MSVDQVRIDKWLWAARFFKTRTLAATAVENGRVRIDGERVKPARKVRCGELLHIDIGGQAWFGSDCANAVRGNRKEHAQAAATGRAAQAVS